MADPQSLVGRSVKILDVNTELWNGVHALVTSYRASDDLYEVTNEQLVEHFRSGQLEPYTPVGFLTRFPNAPVIKGSHSMTEIPGGAVIDFSTSDPSTASASGELLIKGSCRIVGRAKLNSTVNTNTISNHIIVHAEEQDIVEFESVCFDPSGLWLTCAQGTVVFRSCIFVNSSHAVTIGSEKLASTVVFDHCSFSNHIGCALVVVRGRATIVQCTFKDVGMGVSVCEDSFVDIRSSTFTSCTGGVVIPYEGEARVEKCHFEGAKDFCVLASNGSKLHVEGCTMKKCLGDGIVVEGGGGSAATIKDCRSEECRIGVRIGNGRVKVNILNTASIRCRILYYITADATGWVTSEGSGGLPVEIGIVNLSGDNCIVTWDDVEEPEGTLQARLFDVDCFPEIYKSFKYGYPITSRTKQILHAHGTITLECSNCKTEALEDEIFKKCAMCRDAHYCSKQCQVAHWHVHRVRCKVANFRSYFLSTRGFVSCSHCFKVESQCWFPFSACSRCLNVVYCSKECQKASWECHKQVCKRR